MSIDNQVVNAEARKRFIEMLQKQLIRENPSALPLHGVDGLYGLETTEWVTRFQERKGLQVDGIAGPETLGRLRADIVQRPNTSGRGVELLQEDLLYFYIQQSAVDGNYGPGTTQGVRDFQFLNNMVVDGVAGPITLKKMDELITTILVQRGDTGSLVRRIQNQLNEQDEVNISIDVDGSYGPETEAAVVEFQEATKQQRVDGIAGPVTINLLDLEAFHPSSLESQQQFLSDNGIRVSSVKQNQDVANHLENSLSSNAAFQKNLPSNADNHLSSSEAFLITTEIIEEEGHKVSFYHLFASLDEENEYIKVHATFNEKEELETFTFIVVDGEAYEDSAELLSYDVDGNIVRSESDTLLELTNADLDIQKEFTRTITSVRTQNNWQVKACDIGSDLIAGAGCASAGALIGTGIGIFLAVGACTTLAGGVLYDEYDCDQYAD